MSNSPDLDSSDGKSKPVVAVLIALISALAACGVAWLQYRGSNQPRPPISTAVAPTTTIAPEDPKLEIKAPSGLVDQCAFIEGKGTAPPGSAIWVAEHAVGGQAYYGLTPVEGEESGDWHGNIDLGPKGTKFDVFAFVLGAEATALLKNLDVGGEGLPYFKNLPGRKVSIRVTKKPGGDSPC
jgi:hypothetical protein